MIWEKFKDYFILQSDWLQNNLYKLQLFTIDNNKQNSMFSVCDIYTL